MVCCLIMIIINTFRTNLQHKFNNFIKLGTHMQYTYSEGGLATTTNYDGALTELWRYGWPTLPVLSGGWKLCNT